MTQHINIDGRVVGIGQPAFVIAEVGSNHDGDFAIARRYVEEAARVGADGVKFQTIDPDLFLAETIIIDGVARTDGPRRTANFVQTPPEWYARLFEYARSLGLVAFSTPFDHAAVDLLVESGTPALKIASCDITNLMLLERAAAARIPLIVSTGMSTLGEVDRALRTIRGAGAEQVVLLHCVSQYPTPFEDANLRAIGTLQAAFDVPIGLSDHTAGPATAVAAVALGANVVEKHITLDRRATGIDHHFAMEVDEFATMVALIRQVEAALGSGEKEPSDAERDRRPFVRRGLHAAREIAIGQLIETDDVIALRPESDYVRADEAYELVGLRARRPYPVGTPMRWQDFAEA